MPVFWNKGDKFQEYFNQDANIFIQVNDFEMFSGNW